MTRPTKKQVMQRRRRAAEQAAKAAQSERLWDSYREAVAAERARDFRDTDHWLADTRQRAQLLKAASEQQAAAPRWSLREWLWTLMLGARSFA